MPQTKTRIEKAFTQFRWMQVLDWWWEEIPETMYVYFKDAIEDNLPPHILIEAVEKLRDKYKHLWDLFYEDDGSILHRINIVSELEALLPKQQDDTN